MSRPVRSPLEHAWATAYQRHHQLGMLDVGLLELETKVRQLFDDQMRLKIDEELGERLDEANEASRRFALQGEICFMFAESGLNRLAETIEETRTPGSERENSRSFSDLRKSVEKAGDEATRNLQPLIGEMRAANLLVVIPRHVMSVHPPAGIAPSGYSFRPDERLRLRAPRLWPPDSTTDDESLRQILSRDVGYLPSDIEGELLARWAIDEMPEKLSDVSGLALRRYFRRYGCVASPGDAIGATRSLIEHCGQALGYPPSEWAMDIGETAVLVIGPPHI
jgi:hypothetical protein